MLSKHEEQAERLDVLENEKRLKRGSSLSRGTSDIQGSTYLGHTHNDVGGRFSAISNPTVIGATAVPNYPAASAWSADPGSQMLEPPLSPYDNPALEPPPSDLGPSVSPAKATPNPSSQAPPLADEGLGSSQRAYRRF
jgi:hypothetical protein